MGDVFDAVLLGIAQRIGAEFAYMYGTVEEEDAVSVALVAGYERKKYLDVMALENPELMYVTLRRVVDQHYRKDRARALAETDAYHYDPEYVRLFLPFWFAFQDWANGPVNEDSAAEFPTAEAIDTAIDIRESWPTLKGWQQRVIVARHLTCRPTIDGGVDWGRIATECKYSSEAYAQNRYRDATRELSFNMNVNRDRRVKAHEGPGSRSALSIRSAHAVLSRD